MEVRTLNGWRHALLATVAVVAGASCAMPGLSTSSPKPSPAEPNASPTNGVVAYDADHRVVVLVTAGTLPQTEFMQTWTWNGRTWSRRTPITSPTVRNGALLAYDPGRHVTVLQGGLAASPTGLTDTWDWDGTNWRRLTPVHAPDPAQEPGSMAYDPVSKRMMLYQLPNQTWGWDGSDWARLKPAHVPDLWAGNLVFDGSRMILAGGSGAGARTETWGWNGADWQLLAVGHTPQVPPMGTAIFDTTHQKVVLFGGGAGDDTWTWDGSRWARQHPRHSPSNGGPAQLVYDAALASVVAFIGPEPDSVDGAYGWTGSDWKAIAGTASTVVAGRGAMSATAAELTIRRDVTGTHPVLLPLLPKDVNEVLVTADATTFSLRAMNDDRSIDITFGIIVPGNSNLGAPGKTLAFRRDAAQYQYVADDPTGWRDLWWMERPGSSTSDFGLKDRTGIPYLLSATGLTEAQFFSIAASLH